ncbi:MAG: hypothetical protein P8J27_01495 [Mariniblastus sp.]|nr:hypothetical protein [Mariniblastus sp.]
MLQEPIPPGTMLRSFLTVSSSLVLTVVSSIVATFGLGLTCFPQFKKYYDAGDEALQAVMSNNPSDAIPPLMFWSAVLLTAVACLAIGYYIIKTAPFSHFAHAIFVAVLLFIYYLQTAIADPPAKKTMTLVYMIVFPMAILIGAQWTINRMVRKHESEQARMLDEG